MTERRAGHHPARPACGIGRDRRRRKALHTGNKRADAGWALPVAIRSAVLPAIMTAGAVGLTAILVGAGALEFSENGNPIVMAINIVTSVVLFMILACAPFSRTQTVMNRAAELDMGSIPARVCTCVIVAIYAIVVFWAGPGYAANSVPTADRQFWTLANGGKSMFVTIG